MIDPTATERDDVEMLADAFLASYRAGERPNIDEFVGQFPELADDLHDLLKAVMILEQNVPPPDMAMSNANGTTASQELPRQIGDFSVVRELGRGGMGVVYEAVQQSLNRRVALKVLSTPGLLNPAHLERFRREARAAARLQHCHIVPVFGFGAHDGTYHYAMQYVPGQSLDMVIESLHQARSKTDPVLNALVPIASTSPDTPRCEQSRPSTGPDRETCAPSLSDTQFSTNTGRRQFYRDVARIGLQAAEALAYAHSEGVLHRDIKPSNLLLDAKGNIWILDFGLARSDDDDDLTRTGDLVGTLRYTAPERLEGWSDRRSDIYSLGVTLYELMTLRPFFANKSRAELLRRIAEDTPPAPRRIDSAIPVDLETIVLKAVATEPAARYHRAEQMAEDLRRFIGDRPILARRSTMFERLGRWCRRNPVIALLTTTVVALLVTAIVILALSNARIRRESAAKIAAFKDRETALSDKDEAVGKMWLYRGLYGIDDDQAATLSNFDKALALAPNKADVLWLRGFTLGGWGRWNEALADMTKARPLLRNSKLISPAARDWFVAMAYVAKDDRASYQAACREALDKIPSEPKLDERGTLLWMCTVTPYALENPSRLADFAPSVLPPNEDAPTSDQLLDVGAAQFRAGRLPESRQFLERTLRQIAEGKSTVDPNSEIFAHLFLAMTASRLKLTEQAQASFAEADRLSKTIKPECWVDKLQLKLLTDEARTTIVIAR